MKISSEFDGGNIECLSCEQADDIKLIIRQDEQSDFYQWFYFRLTGAQGQSCRLRITNASGSAYTDGWDGYQAVASYDRKTWFRVPSCYENGELTISYSPQHDSVYFAYFAPYSLERHADLINHTLASDLVNLEVLGSTIDGRDIELLQIGEPESGKKVCWFLARQHPGESMAEWWMEGFLDRLLDADDPVSRKLLADNIFYIVPNMNPDGSFRGHLRTNAVGVNLNREWLEPSAERSPEVYFVRQKMAETGVDFCMDVHGDEAIPHNFIAGAEGIKSWSDAKQKELDTFKNLLAGISPDFQTIQGYPVDEPGTANMTVCTHYVAEQFNCLSMTLEMPFKDADDLPDADFGWSAERSVCLGAACVDAVFQTLR